LTAFWKGQLVEAMTACQVGDKHLRREPKKDCGGETVFIIGNGKKHRKQRKKGAEPLA